MEPVSDRFVCSRNSLGIVLELCRNECLDVFNRRCLHRQIGVTEGTFFEAVLKETMRIDPIYYFNCGLVFFNSFFFFLLSQSFVVKLTLSSRVSGTIQKRILLKLFLENGQ